MSYPCCCPLQRGEIRCCFVFYPPFPPRGASASSRPWGDINGASFKIRWEDETQAVSAHWRVLPLCVLSESHCNSTSSFFPFVFSPVESLFSFLFLATIYFSLVFFSVFSTFFIPQIHFSHSHVASRLPKGFTSVCEKSSNIPLVGFACVCVFIQSCCGILKPFVACFLWSFGLSLSIELRKGNTKPANAHGRRVRGREESSVISTIHISRPDEASRVHLSPAVNSRSSPPPLTVPSHRKQAKGTLHPTGGGGFLSLCTHLVVSAINQHSPGITGAVFWAAVWPDVWPRCDCSLG